jgi:hypothetical protein
MTNFCNVLTFSLKCWMRFIIVETGLTPPLINLGEIAPVFTGFYKRARRYAPGSFVKFSEHDCACPLVKQKDTY